MKLKDIMKEGSGDGLRMSDPLWMILNKKLIEFGIRKQIPNRLTDKMWELESGKVDTSKFGIFKNAFKELTYKVLVGGSSENRVVTFEIKFDWKYEGGGSNGHTIRMTYREKAGKWF